MLRNVLCLWLVVALLPTVLYAQSTPPTSTDQNSIENFLKRAYESGESLPFCTTETSLSNATEVNRTFCFSVVPKDELEKLKAEVQELKSKINI